MKRNLADITKYLFRQKKKVLLKQYDISDQNYFVYYADGKFATNILREIENFDAENFIKITINTQTIPNEYFLVETISEKILIKFIKNKFPYDINDADVVELIGQIQ
jgi:hypothetical protein